MTVRDEPERVARRPARATWWLFTLAASAPALWVAGFLSLVVKARLSTGHWPQLWEDPSIIGGSLYLLLAAFLPMLYFFGAAYVLALAVAVCVRPLREALREASFKPWHLVIPACAQTAIAILIHVDPWYLHTWWMD